VPVVLKARVQPRATLPRLLMESKRLSSALECAASFTLCYINQNSRYCTHLIKWYIHTYRREEWLPVRRRFREIPSFRSKRHVLCFAPSNYKLNLCGIIFQRRNNLQVLLFVIHIPNVKNRWRFRMGYKWLQKKWILYRKEESALIIYLGVKNVLLEARGMLILL
jgi:hypothetical protein